MWKCENMYYGCVYKEENCTTHKPQHLSIGCLNLHHIQKQKYQDSLKEVKYQLNEDNFNLYNYFLIHLLPIKIYSSRIPV